MFWTGICLETVHSLPVPIAGIAIERHLSFFSTTFRASSKCSIIFEAECGDTKCMMYLKAKFGALVTLKISVLSIGLLSHSCIIAFPDFSIKAFDTLLTAT